MSKTCITHQHISIFFIDPQHPISRQTANPNMEPKYEATRLALGLDDTQPAPTATEVEAEEDPKAEH